MLLTSQLLRMTLVAALCLVTARPLLGELQLRVIDADTRQPLTARVVLRAADGTYPGDRIGLLKEKWPNLEAHGVFIDGEGSFTLPSGKTHIKVSRGPQYDVQEQEVELVADKKSVVELALTRRIDMRKLGWVGGDAHLHMIHGEMQRPTSYEDVAMTCKANGLDWAYVNQEYTGAGESTLADFHAQCRNVSGEDFQLLLGGERPKSLLGHHAIIGVANPFVVPDDPPYHLSAKTIHDQGGVLFPVHPLRYYPAKQYLGAWLDFPGNNLGREIIFNAHLGPAFDGLSVLSDEPNDRRAHQLWFNLLNKGLFVPAFADSDACFDRPVLHKSVPGFWTTFLYMSPDAAVSNQSLAKAVRQGRTMATTGPLVFWDVDGQMSGATLPTDGMPREINIHAQHHHHNWTLEPAKLSKVELIRNGEVVRVWEPNTPEAKLSFTVKETERCWYAVRAWGTDQRWQVGIASPIYFAEQPASTKQQPLSVPVRGRVYDFVTGQERKARIVVQRHGEVLKEFDADGQFAVTMPLDATIVAKDESGAGISHDLLLDYGPVHRFLWKLDSEAMSKSETFALFEALVRDVELEFPLGYRMNGCYAAKKLAKDLAFDSVKVTKAPQPAAGPAAVAAILLDKRQAKAGDTIHVAVVFHHQESDDRLLVVEGRAYDPRRPTGFNPLKVFDTFEAKWSQASDAGLGYKVLTGKLTIPDWADGGPVDALEINAFTRGQGGKYESHIGLRLPLGETMHELMVVSNWPTLPISWPDHNYGIGPLKVCSKLGRVGQPAIDYRALEMTVGTSLGEISLCPVRDCEGCADADDAVYMGHYFDQALNAESRLLPEPTTRAQPAVQWRKTPVIDATQSPQR